MAPGHRQNPPTLRHSIRNLGRLCPLWSWAPATSLRRSPPRSHLHPRTRRRRAGPAPPAPRCHPPPSAARDGQEEAAAPATAPSPGLVRGSDPPPQGRALAQGTHSTHPHQPAPPKAAAAPRAGADTYLIVSLQVLPGELQHLLLGGCPVVVACGFLGIGRERGACQLLCQRQSCGMGCWGSSPAEARSPAPAGASARGGSGNRPGSAASRHRPGRRACSWRRCAPRPARRSLQGAALGDTGGNTTPRGPQHPRVPLEPPRSHWHSRL